MVTATPGDSGYSLAFETSSAVGSVALGRSGELLQAHTFTGSRRHAVEFLPTVADLCARHSVEPSAIDVVVVSSGPGSFTGLRIGITAARMLAMACDASIVSVPTLQVIAQNAATLPDPPERVAVLLDAKRHRVYAAVFSLHEGAYVSATDAAEWEPERFLKAQDATCAVMGEGVTYHRHAVDASGMTVLPPSVYAPRAEVVLRMGAARARQRLFEDRHTLIPLYVRPPEAEEKRRQRERMN